MKLLSKPDYKVSDRGLSEIVRLTVGGVTQSLLIQTEQPGSPVLLFVHGGPSMPVPGVCARGADYVLVMTTKELVKRYTVVFWDQRGTGKSYAKDIPSSSMHLEQFIRDAVEVTDYLRDRFAQSRIHLAAHSWGSVIALPLAGRHPDRYLTYTGFSQITNWVENDKLSYRWLLAEAKQANDRKALQALQAVGEPPYTDGFDQWAVIRKWQFKYKSMFHDAGDGKSATFFDGFRIMLRSPDCSLTDIYNSLVRGFKLSYSPEMLRDINTFDFFREVPALDIPVMFIHGEQEKHVMPELVQRYYDKLEASQGKQLLWSARSSHTFHHDDARENEARLIAFMQAHALGHDSKLSS